MSESAEKLIASDWFAEADTISHKAHVVTLAVTDESESSAPYLTLVPDIQAPELSPPASLLSSQELVLMLAAILAAFQFADGFLTYAGVSRWGIVAEGNPMIAFMMTEFGVITALSLSKGFSLFCIALLVYVGKSLSWLGKALLALCIFYASAAIIPWMLVLS